MLLQEGWRGRGKIWLRGPQCVCSPELKAFFSRYSKL